MATDIAFRVDASIEIGTGHVMRCLTLVDEFRNQGARCHFICRPHEGHLIDAIVRKGHKVTTLPALPPDHKPTDDPQAPPHARWLGTDWQTDARDTIAALNGTPDWLIIDHYALDARWHQLLRPHCRHLMVIDDLADRALDCDLLLDQNLGRAAADYRALVPAEAQMLIGPEHALLRPEFAALRTQSLNRRSPPALRRLLITLGGIDRMNVTGRILDALDRSALPADVQITVVMGTQAPFLDDVCAQAQRMKHETQVIVNAGNMAELMANSDLAIGAVGSTCWERCCMGLPTLQVVLADNQREVAAILAETGAAIDLGPAETIAARLPQVIEALSSRQLLALSDRAAQICDGGGCTRVHDRMMAMTGKEAFSG